MAEAEGPSRLRASIGGHAGPIPIDAGFEVEGGEIVAVTGASGSGKTTLLRLVAGLLRPATGSLELGGEEWFNGDSGFNLPAEQRRVGMVFQEYALFPRMSAARNVEFGMGKAGRRAKRARAREILAELGLGESIDRLPSQLSGGERQRLALARAIALQPKLLLLDEPLAALDEATATESLALIARTVQQLRVPCLLVTHSRRVSEVAERALVVERGAPVVELPAAEALSAASG